MEETAGGYPAFAALPATYTEKEKEQQLVSHQLPQPDMACGQNLHITYTGDNPAGDNWTNEMTRTNMNFSKPQRALRRV